MLYVVPFLSYLTLNNIVTLKSGLEVIENHSNGYHLKAWGRFPIRLVGDTITVDDTLC